MDTDIPIDAIHGASEAVESIRTAMDQAELANEVIEHDKEQKEEDEKEKEKEIGDQSNDVAVTRVQVSPSPEYDIDFGRMGNFLVKCGINLVLPFVNGMMLGFGEIFAHEVCFRWGWQFARVAGGGRGRRAVSAPAAAAAAGAGRSVLA